MRGGQVAQQHQRARDRRDAGSGHRTAAVRVWLAQAEPGLAVRPAREALRPVVVGVIEPVRHEWIPQRHVQMHRAGVAGGVAAGLRDRSTDD
jgi:hypothetical protein